MDIEIIACLAALILAYAMWRWALRLETPPDMIPETQAMYAWANLPETEKTIERAEEYLASHPDDLPRRIGILEKFTVRELRDAAKLREHTLALIRRMPTTNVIVYANSEAFFRNPGYRDEVVAALKAQLNRGFANTQIQLNLGDILGHAAVPPTNVDEFREWNDLAPDTPVPTELDDELLAQALKHYEAAGETKEWTKSIAAERRAQLLSSASRLDEAIPVFEHALELAAPENRAGLMVDYGECLAKSGQREKAIEVLSKVRENDRGGDRNGPARFTTEAETIMGHLALDAGDRRTARKHLLASADVQTSVENTTMGLPTSLAGELLSHEPDAVAEFCRTALKEFTPEREDFEELLKDAESRLRQQ